MTVEDGYNRYWQEAGSRSLANQRFIAMRYPVIKKVAGFFDKMMEYDWNRRAKQC